MIFSTKISLLLPDLSSGGAERISVNLANEFIRRGYQVEVVLLNSKGILLHDLDARIRVVDLKINRMRWAIWQLWHYLRRERPDALLANMWSLTVIAVLARALARVTTRVVLAEHTTWSRSELLQNPLVGWQVRNSMHYFFPKADGIVAVSQGAANDLALFADVKRSSITVIYNPVVNTEKPPTLEAPTEPAGWCDGTHKRVMAVGTLKAIKDYATLLEAFLILRRSVDARLLILGDGICRAELEAQVHRLGLAGVVFMPGFVVNTFPYYKHTDLQVLSSTGEGLPTVLIEALEAGTPVVSTDCPSGPREILCDGQFGYLVPVGDAQALAGAMAESLESQHDSDALKARAQYFSIDKAVDQYEAMLFPNVKLKADI